MAETEVILTRADAREDPGLGAGYARCCSAEALGTFFLLAAVVGSGIMGERLAGGNVAIALLANSLATGAALLALILALGPVSGAHLNPVVTLVEMFERKLPPEHGVAYLGAQILGAVGGVVAAHLMFGLPVVSLSHHARSGFGQLFSEFVATFGLVLVIKSCCRFRPAATAFAVAAYIASAYWFTASTSFANPAVTLARALTDTFSGIRPVDVPAFVLAQFAGGISAAIVFRRVFEKVQLQRATHSEAPPPE